MNNIEQVCLIHDHIYNHIISYKYVSDEPSRISEFKVSFLKEMCAMRFVDWVFCIPVVAHSCQNS